MKRRNSIDIMADILRISISGAKKTRIVYGANLNFKIVKGYLSELREKGLLEFQTHSKKYITTERGIEFLKQYEKIRRLQRSSIEQPFDSPKNETWPSDYQHFY